MLYKGTSDIYIYMWYVDSCVVVVATYFAGEDRGSSTCEPSEGHVVDMSWPIVFRGDHRGPGLGMCSPIREARARTAVR